MAKPIVSLIVNQIKTLLILLKTLLVVNANTKPAAVML